MPTSTMDRLQDQYAGVIDRVADTTRHAEHLAHEARQLKSRAADAFEDGVHAARRTMTRRMRDLEDLRDQATTRIRRQPLATVCATFAAGAVFGAMIAWAGSRPARRRR